MKNITVSVPDEVYHAARVKAAEMGTSVSAIVREQLGALSRSTPTDRGRRLQERFERIRSERKGQAPFRVNDILTREELYEDAFRRHERSDL